jgi:PLP dependent protein
MTDSICDRLNTVQTRIKTICKECGRDPDELTLVAVSKTKPISSIETAIGCGHLHFGENRARELEEKMEALGNDRLTWHFVGPMQTNKIKYMADRVDWIHSVYKKKYLKEIEKRAAASGRNIQVLLQVNISRESQKQGCRPDELTPILDYAKQLKNVRVRGLMGMASFTEDKEEVRSEFRLLRETLEHHRMYNDGAVQLDHLSMGMTHDLDIAIEEGSTMLRVGTAIFGERDYE